MERRTVFNILELFDEVLTICKEISFSFWVEFQPHDKSSKTMDNSFKSSKGASLVAQWLRICLPMQGTGVRALVREDPTCRGATKPVRHNY